MLFSLLEIPSLSLKNKRGLNLVLKDLSLFHCQADVSHQGAHVHTAPSLQFQEASLGGDCPGLPWVLPSS